jgi:hypothetical protein
MIRVVRHTVGILREGMTVPPFKPTIKRRRYLATRRATHEARSMKYAGACGPSLRVVS